MSQPLHIRGALIWDGEHTIERDLFVKNGHIVKQKPNHAIEIDLEGYTLFPGLINAHDHLELNHYPRTKFRDVYDNAHQWGEDVNTRLNDEPFKTLRSYPIWDRLFIGGLKNLLCGATTVIHHGPKYREMFRKDFPVRVLKNYGWSHSLHFDSEADIIKSYKSTPKDVPWFIHLAEGTDDVAAGEFTKLEQLGCVGENTVIIHGTGLTFEDVNRAYPYTVDTYGVQLIWCPSSNYYLFGDKAFHDAAFTTGHWNVLHAWTHLFGSDSRLTANGDLLDEIRFAFDEVNVHWVEDMIFQNLWYIYRNSTFQDLPPDFLIVNNELFEEPAEISSFEKNIRKYSIFRKLSRANVSSIVQNGIPQLGSPEMMAKFTHIQTVACTVDGVEKRMNIDLAKQVHRCKLKERGLDVDDLPTNKRFFFF